MALRDRLVSELDKKLDWEIGEILESPKLRLNLSPAEVDKSLLDLYTRAAEGTGGDILRTIGGGGPVALQHLYMRRQTMREFRRRRRSGRRYIDPIDFFPSLLRQLDDQPIPEDERKRTTRQWVRWALLQNIPKTGNVPRSMVDDTITKKAENEKDTIATATTTRLSLYGSHRSPSSTLSKSAGVVSGGFGRPQSFLNYGRSLNPSRSGLSLLI